MTTDEAIRAELRFLKVRRAELLADLKGTEAHDCNCEYCGFEKVELDSDEKMKIEGEIKGIEANIARFSALKLSEDVCS